MNLKHGKKLSARLQLPFGIIIAQISVIAYILVLPGLLWVDIEPPAVKENRHPVILKVSEAASC